MASYHGSNHSEPAKIEQIITEFFAKSLHIVLESRCPYVSSRNYSGEQGLSSPSSSSSSSSSVRPRDRWFNLALKDCPAALENIDFWRQSNLDPMVVDIVLVKRSSDWDPLSSSPKRGPVRNFWGKERHFWNSEHDEFGCEAKSEKIIERWIVQYESRKNTSNAGCSGNKRSNSASSSALYKKSTLLLRSLYVMIRLLPAYKLFRDLVSSAQIRTYSLGHRINSFVEPFTRREEAEMQKFVFTPVDTSWGRLSLSVMYSSSVSDVNSEPSTPISPKFITNYVGSPMADRLKRFPSLPVPQCSPSSSPFGRRHSWSYDLYRASPPSTIPSPSPTYSESHASISRPRSHRLPPSSVPRNLPGEAPLVYMKNTGFDEYSPSPTFSPSPSPSPPTYVPGGSLQRVLLRSESAPLSIPSSKLSGGPSVSNNQMLPPSPPVKSVRPSANKMDGRSGLFQTSSAADKLFPLGKDEPRKLSGAKISSNSSPQKSISRTSSRLSFQEDYDDSDYSGPFVVEDDEVTDPGSRPGSFDQLGHPYGTYESGGLFPVKKSQAAVGQLIRVLQKAPPLHQDLLNSANMLVGSTPQTMKNCSKDPHQFAAESGTEQSASLNLTSSTLHASKTTADALEELRVYSAMKHSLLKQGNSQI